MGIVIAAIAVVGGIIYVLFVLLSYFNDSARLSQELEAVKVRMDGQFRRLGDYEARAAQLQEDLPKRRKQCDRLRLWIDLLKNQKAQLDRERTGTKLLSHQERTAVIFKGMTKHRRGKQG
jgi:uncharacterized membrane-anchored protein YhcB (DUF1043 family)